MNFYDLATMPLICLFLSPACNLHCPYCSSAASSKLSPEIAINKQGYLLPFSEILELIHNIPPTHIILSGGEPLIYPNIKKFIATAGKYKHKISFATNISISLNKLKNILGSFDSNYFGFISIAHHIINDIPIKYIEERTKLLKNLRIPFFIRYIGVPELIPQIKKNILYLKEQKIGATATILYGNWKGRRFPEEYTLEETISLLNLVTLNTYGFQFFGGIFSQGILCRGGQDFITYNMNNNKEIIPCCHGSNFPLNINNTFFKTRNREKTKCFVNICLNDGAFIFNLHGLTNEVKQFAALCKGNFDFVGISSVLHFTKNIIKKGIKIVDTKKLKALESYLEKSYN